MGDAAADDKLSYFQAITGVDDLDLCREILSAHNWDLDLAVSTFTSSSAADHRPPPQPAAAAAVHRELGLVAPPHIAWRLITLPFSLIAGTLGLVSGAIGLGIWAAGGILSYSMSTIGLNFPRHNAASTSSSLSPPEAAGFVTDFENNYGNIHPNFIAQGFNEALQRSRHEYKLLFVYLHSPDHPDTEVFCEGTLCSEVLSAFINENFVAWGGSIRAPEGFKMSNSLKASRFPFCAVVMAATNQRIALLQQVEGPKSTEEMLTILQRVLEESAPVLVSARLDAEERRNNTRLREEQDAAYRAALEADQARERQRKEEEERVEREAAEAERKKKEEDEARERAALEAVERETKLAKIREEKVLSLGAEPEKGPNVTQVLVRFPNGDRQGRRFDYNSKIQSIYDYVDSLGSLEIDSYSLVSNFPRVVYGQEKLNLSLKEAGLHPQASLFVEISS